MIDCQRLPIPSKWFDSNWLPIPWLGHSFLHLFANCRLDLIWAHPHRGHSLNKEIIQRNQIVNVDTHSQAAQNNSDPLLWHKANVSFPTRLLLKRTEDHWLLDHLVAVVAFDESDWLSVCWSRVIQRWVIAIKKKSITNYITNYFILSNWHYQLK